MGAGNAIRRFRPEDADAVVALWETCFPDDPPRNAPRSVIARKVARDPDLFWVAVDPAGDVVGAVLAGYDGYRGWLYHLAVAPERRREGIATALVDVAVEALSAVGCPKVNLQVRESNTAVVGFYRSLGWTEDATVSLGRTLAPGN